MSTITVPLTPDLEQFIEEQTHENFISKAALIRKALKAYQEEVELQEILLAQQEYKEGKALHGDPRKLVKKFQ